MILSFLQLSEKCAPVVLKRTTDDAKTGRENGFFRSEKLKTDFQRVKPTWEQRKNISEIIQNMSDIIRNMSDIFFAS